MENWANLKEERSALNIKAVCADRASACQQNISE